MPGTYTTGLWTPQVGRPYEYRAFAPALLDDRLPDRWPVALIESADDALTRLAALPSEALLAGLGVHLGRAEAGGSSMIEGHYVQSRRLFEMQVEPEASVDDRALPVYENWEVMQRVRRVPALDAEELLAWHRLLMAHDPRAMPGAFRDIQNWIGGDGYGPRNAVYVPPPPDRVRALIEDLVDYGQRSAHHPTVKAAVLHVQFESIHPFVDGNGRLGRALLHWALRDVAPSVPPISLVWCSHGDHYFNALDGWRLERDPSPWISYFTSSLVTAADAAQDLLLRLGDLRAKWLGDVPARSGSLKRRLLEDLVASPIVDAAMAASRLDATPSSFSRTARELEEAGVLTETHRQRRRAGRPRTVYEAREVFDTIDDFVAYWRSGSAV